MSFVFGVGNNWFTFYCGQDGKLFMFFVLWDVIAM
jgi:hypothetical protein